MKFHYIYLFFCLILYFIYYKLDDNIKFKIILTADAFSNRKVCTTGTDDTTCRDVNQGEIAIPSNSVIRLKVIRENGDGYFLTFRRDYVLVSYFLTYIQEIPLNITEVVRELPVSEFNQFSYTELNYFAYNCMTDNVEGADERDSDISENYYNYFRGQWCECPGLNLMGDSNTIKRVVVYCSTATRIMYPSVTAASRHCAQVAHMYYSLYEIQNPPVFKTVVDVKAEMYNYNDVKKARKTNNLVTHTESVTLTDSKSEIRLDTFDLWINLRNEYSGKNGLVNLTTDYILIPSFPLTEQNVKESDLNQFCGLDPDSPYFLPCDYKAGVCKRVHYCLRHVIVLPKKYFDLSGATCDKIGVSLHTWRSYGADRFCYYEAGTCLANQLSKYVAIHYESISENKVSPYKLRSLYGSEAQIDFYPSSKLFEVNASSIIDTKKKKYDDFILHLKTAAHYHSLEYRYNADHFVKVYFETSAKAVYEIRPTGNGVISHVTPPKNCSATQQESDKCAILVHAWNQSKNETVNFSCMLQCFDSNKNQHPFIQPVSKISAAIGPDKTYVFFFVIKIITNKAFDANCEAQLLDSSGKQVSEQSFKIHGEHSVQTSNEIREPVKKVEVHKYERNNSEKGSNADKPCCRCGLNIFCYIWNLFSCVKCITAIIISFLGKIAMIAALVFVIPIIIPFLPFIFSFLFKIVLIPFRICFYCLRMQNERRKEQREQERIRNEEKKKEQERMKKKENRKKKQHTKKYVSSSDQSDRSYTSHSHHKKKHTRKRKISSESQYSGTSLEESISSSDHSSDSRNSYRSNDSNDYSSSSNSGRRSKYRSSS